MSKIIAGRRGLVNVRRSRQVRVMVGRGRVPLVQLRSRPSLHLAGIVHIVHVLYGGFVGLCACVVDSCVVCSSDWSVKGEGCFHLAVVEGTRVHFRI
jgi:hypothetical protein